jgi:hypothetical protein
MATTYPDSDRSTEPDKTDPDVGFVLGPPEDHTIELYYDWRFVDTMKLTDDGFRRHADQEGYPAENGNDDVRCTCGREFESVPEAKAHLKRELAKRRPPMPTQTAATWSGRTTDCCDGHVTIVTDNANAMGKVISGTDYLVATSRATFDPPERFQFEQWGPLSGGRLTRPDGSALFGPRRLQMALAALTGTADYEPSRYTIFFRGGEAPLYIEGNRAGVIVAPLIR